MAGIATLVAAAVSARALDLDPGSLRVTPLVLALGITPLVILLNAAELRAMAQIVTPTRRELPWVKAIRTTTLATAANLLPVPAGALLRIQVMCASGATLARASAITVAAAALWIALSTTLAGAALLVLGLAPTATAAALVGGGVVAVGGVAATRRLAAGSWRRPTALLVVVEATTSVTHAVRLYLVLLGLGEAVGLLQSLVIGASTPLAAAAGFLPGGVGLAELLSALLGPLADVAPAAALLATALTRVLGLAVVIPTAMALGLRDLTSETSRSGTGEQPRIQQEDG